MSLVRFCCTRAIVRNKVNCISPSSAGRSNQVLSPWLAATTTRDYHSGKQQSGDALGQFSRGLASQPPPGAIGQRDPLNTGFADPIAAFKSKTLIELIRAYAVYMICSSAYLVENNMKVCVPPVIYVLQNLIFSYVIAVE